MELLDAEGRGGGVGSSVSGEEGQRRGELREPRGGAMVADEDGSGGRRGWEWRWRGELREPEEGRRRARTKLRGQRRPARRGWEGDVGRRGEEVRGGAGRREGKV